MGKAMLLIALGLSSVMASMLYNINARTLDLTETSYERHTRMVARNGATSAANIVVSELYRDFTWAGPLDTTFYNDGIFTATVQDVAIDTPLAIARVRVTAIGSYNGLADTVSVMLAQPAFSYYGLLSDSWPGSEYFDTGDTLLGPIHTNGEWNFTGSPVFFGKATHSGNSLPGGTPQFYGGYDVEVPAISVPANLPAFIDSANAGGDVYAIEVWLRFNADGTYDYGNDNTYSLGTKNLSSYNGTIMTSSGPGDKDIHVKGTLRGQVTIYSERDIRIEDDILYSQDPRIVPGSQDVLGLIAEGEVVVEQNAANNTDCEIHAAIMALNNSFEVENYALGLSRGTLTVVGSVIQRDRGDLGTYLLGVTLTGYAPDWQYDRRYLNVGPPFFPLVSRAIVLSWDE